MDSIARLLAGFDKHCAKKGGLVVNAETLKPKEVIACLQQVMDSADRVDVARRALKAALDEEQNTIDKNADVVDALKLMALSSFRNKADILGDFGLAKRPRKQRTVEEKSATVRKVLATREARHTMGRKQKEGIHGTTPAAAPPTKPVSTPAESPSAPSTGPEPPPIVPVVAPVLNGTNAANGAAANGGG